MGKDAKNSKYDKVYQLLVKNEHLEFLRVQAFENRCSVAEMVRRYIEEKMKTNE